MNKKRNLLLTFLVVIGIVIVNLLTSKIFDGLANTYLAEFLNELKAVALGVLGAFILKKVDLPPLRPGSFQKRMDGSHSAAAFAAVGDCQ